MPKLKTHSGTKKRFKLTKKVKQSGKLFVITDSGNTANL